MTGTKLEEELTAPLEGVRTGSLVFARGASHLTIGTDGSMKDLFRARFEGKTPEVRVEGGTVTIRYRAALHPPVGEITLSSRVPWSIRARMGMSEVTADLRDLELEGIEISGGASKIVATLPRPKGTVRIGIGGGSSRLELIRPEGVPVGVRVGSGASKLALDDFSGSGKIEWRSPDYDRHENRYDIEIGAGASRVTVRS